MPKCLCCAQREVRTEITFDFHRLGVLLLRAAVVEGAVVARKIATATVCEAKIQATLGAYLTLSECDILSYKTKHEPMMIAIANLYIERIHELKRVATMTLGVCRCTQRGGGRVVGRRAGGVAVRGCWRALARARRWRRRLRIRHRFHCAPTRQGAFLQHLPEAAAGSRSTRYNAHS
jgi:hypothetical protein